MKLTTFNVNGIRAAMDKGLRDYLLTRRCRRHLLAGNQGPGRAGRSVLVHRLHRYLEQRREGLLRHASAEPRAGETHSLGAWRRRARQGRPRHHRRVRRLPFGQCLHAQLPGGTRALAVSPSLGTTPFCNTSRSWRKPSPCWSAAISTARTKRSTWPTPKSNRKNPGFSDEERASFDNFINAGITDVFRHFDPNPGRYTWWTQRTGGSARDEQHRLAARLLARQRRRPCPP